MLRNSERGQTLIEVVVTLGVALIIITSILVLVSASNRRSTIARQSAQASKLALQGMEVVRNIRDENQSTVYIGCSSTPCTWNELYSNPIGTAKGCIYLDATPKWTLHPLLSSNCDEEKVGGSLGGASGSGIFGRLIEISDSNIPSGPAQICSNAGSVSSTVKRITVTVSWTSPQGDQDRTVVGCLTNWK